MIIIPPPEKSQITSNIWMGAITKDVQKFKFIFNVVGNCPYYISIGQKLVVNPLNDSPTIPDKDMLYQLAKDVLDSSKKGLTYVHCAQGINRSGLIVALALILDGMKPQEAIDLLREKRHQIVLSNQHFEKWLLAQ